MADEPIAIARVRLARSLPRILALPALLVVLGVAALGAPLVLGGAAGIAIGAGGVVMVGVGIGCAVLPLSLRLEVEVGGVRLRWLAGARRYHLVPGAVTRATMTGPAGSAIRPRLALPGWSYGAATLRGEEPISIVRLAPTASVILVPTDRGRLAIAAASEPELLEALAAAARVQQRLDEVSGRLLAARAAPEPALEERAAFQAPSESIELGMTPAEGGPRIMTGIERARLEAELAAARQAAIEEAEAERAALAESRTAAAADGTAVQAPAPVAPAWTEEAEPPLTAPSAARRRARGTWTRPGWATDARLAVMVTIAWALVPLAGSGIAFLLFGGSPALAADDTRSRVTALALVAGGPAAALGILASRAWWPRLTGLVVTTALAALVLATRAGLG